MKLGEKVVIIARLPHPDAEEITIQNFVIEGKSVLPVFSDVATFEAEIVGSGFEDAGVEVTREFLVAIMRGDEEFVLNPGSLRQPVTIAQLKAGEV